MFFASHLLSDVYRQTAQHNRLLALIGVSYSLLLAVVSSSDVPRPFSGHVTYDKCSFSNVFRQLFHVSFESCIDECLLRRRCSNVQYNNAFHMCLLSGDDDSHEIASFSTSELACIIANMAGWDTSHLRSCSAHECGMTERCNADVTNALAQCEPSECLLPPIPEHASLCSNAYGIGMKNAYCCKEGHVPVGNQSITCLENGTWTATNVVCAKPCPYPDEVPNAELVDIIGDGLVEGTQLMFTCKSGYVQSNGTSLSSECTAEGKWKPGSFECCPPGYKSGKGSCYQSYVFPGSSSYDDMKQHCSQEDLRMASMTLVEHMLENDPDSHYPVMVKEKKIDRIDDIAKCIEGYDTTTLGGQSFDAHIQYVRDNGITCTPASKWAAGEPNGGTNQPCILGRKVVLPNENTTEWLDDVCANSPYFPVLEFVCYEKYKI